MGNMRLRFQLYQCGCIILVLAFCQISWCSSNSGTEHGKYQVDKSNDGEIHNLGGFQTKSQRDPISDNSTLGQALALARQFLVREENIITSANMELFKRSEAGDGVPANVTTKPKLFSWWMFKRPTPSSELTTTTEEPEESEEAMTESPEQDTTMMPESTQTSVNEETTTMSILDETTTIYTSPSDLTTTSIPDTTQQPITTPTKSPPLPISETTSSPPEFETLPSTSTTVPPISKRTRKPRPSKRPSKRPKTTPTSNSDPSPDDTATLLPSQDATQPPPPPPPQEPEVVEMPPNSIKDPFGVKRKFATFVKNVGKAVLNQTRRTVEKAGPVAKDGARRLGIIALTAVGQVGNLTKTTAEDAFDNLARKLNATELVDPRRNPEQNSSHTTPDPRTSGQMSMGHGDDEPCSGVDKQNVASNFGVFLGTMGLLLMKQVVT